MAARLSRPPRFDASIALAGLAGGLVLWGFGLGLREAQEPMVLFAGRWALLVPLVVISGCELLRRTAPRTALLIGTAALAADTVTQGSIATIVMYTDLAYAAVVYGPPATARRLPKITGVLTVAAIVIPYAVWRVPEALLIGLVVAAVSFGPASTGLIVRNHRDAAEAARLRAEQTALLAEMDRTQAVNQERARMARELHDVVANHLSAIAIHSTAALSLDEPRTSHEALTVIRENSVQGLSEMRRLIGILRDRGDEREPAAVPTLDGLAALVEGARANGLDAVLDSEPCSVPAPVELAAYRIVQESLTNALKHAGPGRVTVRLRCADGTLDVRVTSPHGGGGAPRVPGSGAGLVGMRERTELLGGTFEAGPEEGPRDPDEGPDGTDRAGGAHGPAGTVWTVRATLPVTDTDSAPGDA
ncbi:sensor histidine kinase [Streptomyces sp. bgisy022]|uniref:sensor histidine kinase n=1 Tax=Streptomyces sp. bgisy022 TaxID=3413769 RepID=UPI003D743E6C